MITNEKRLDLISRTALIAEYDRVHIGAPGAARKLIEDAPTVEAVEVMRCKDCIYYHKELGYGFGQCSKCNLMPYPDDFCSYGERKRK